MTTSSEPSSSKDDALTLAYFRLKDLGLDINAGEGDYSMSYLLKMKRAVEIVWEFTSDLPADVEAECQIKYFSSFREIESFRDMFKPSIKRDMQKQRAAILSAVSLITCPMYGESNAITPLLKYLPVVIDSIK